MAIMYNQEQKQEYIIYENSNQDAIRRYFARLMNKEEEYGKDIANMSLEELKETIYSLNIRREESRGHLLSLLRGYINWAVLNGKANNSSVINSVTAESVGSQDVIRNTMIKDPEHLRTILDNALDYVNYENRSIRDALVFWLLYCGMMLEEIPYIKKNDLNITTRTITLESGKHYSVNDEVLNLWDKCSKMDYIEKRNGRSSDAKSKNVKEYTKYDLVDNDYLFRPIMGNNPDQNRNCKITIFRKIILNVFQDSGKNIPARNIKYSGIFYQIYLLESSGRKITPEIFAEYFWIDYKNKNELMVKTRKWRIDYDDWKLAFGYMY